MTETTRVDDPRGTEVELESLLEFIRDARGFDFTGYKRPSLRRRIAHRMEAVRTTTYRDYQEHLERNEGEFIELFNTILINVTAFFRDTPAWTLLRETIVPRIVESKQDGQIRIWSAGCATGEEAYSLAMIFADALDGDALADRVKIYATDIDEDALADARHANYPESALENVPREFRERYFERVDARYVFNAAVRRAVIFGRNDLLADPPISRVDLIAARNTLMYFRPEAQTKILANFHFALNREGYLFLGRSEVLLTRSNLFEPVDLKRRVFAKIPGGEFRDGLRQLAHTAAAAARPDEEGDEERIRRASFEAAPVAYLVIDRGGNLAAANVQARALFGLALADLGRPLQDLEVSYRPIELRSRIDEVYAAHHTVAVREVEWPKDGTTHWFDIQLSPLHAPDGEALGVGVTFTETTRFRSLRESLEVSKERLETAYEELQSTAEELETTNEELQSTNEELETTNEELQSTNEELETMNEELQSTNEELHTINDELRDRTDDLNQVNAFLESILGSLGAAVVVTDSDFRVQAWNEHARELWGLTSAEAQNQHLANLDIGLPVDRVMPLARAAFSGSEEPSEAELEAVNRRGRPIRCRVTASPLAAPDGDVRGVILLMRAVDNGAAEA